MSQSKRLLYNIADHPTPKIDGGGIAYTLNSRDYKSAQVIALENHPADSRVKISEDNIVQTLSSRMGTGGGNTPMALDVENYIVRRLTPLECERLQGYPDGWTDIGKWTDSKGKKHKGESDAPRYKALGNSIALPFWEWMAQRMVEQLKADGVENPTMASLFDGIGGFPLVYQRCGCEPVWASEIEEFPIAVTKIRFPDEVKEKIKGTQFRKGQRPHNAQPIGSESKIDGYWKVKIAEPNVWQLKSRHEWERIHGEKLRPSDKVLFLDKNADNFAPDNLVRVTAAELARINQDNLRGDNQELNMAAVNLARLKTLAKEKQKKNKKGM